MFKKLHLQMTFFCTLVTGLILVMLSCICLYISEQGNSQNSYASFRNNVNSMLSHLESQTTISLHWIHQIEAGYQFSLDIRDNGQPLYFQTLDRNPALETIREQAADLSRKQHGIDISRTSTGNLLPQHAEFPMLGSDGRDYYISAALLPREQSVVSVMTLYSLDEEKKAILHQRFLFLAVDLIAILLLAVFSWFFSGRMIRPIRESRERQSQFIASASHELRSPLTVMLTSLSAMKMANEKDSNVFFQMIWSEGERMSRLIGDMLSLANADNGSWSINPKKLELDTLLLQVYEKSEPIAREKKRLLSVTLPDAEIPSCKCDGERIAQVLFILLDNAFCYIPEGGSVQLSLALSGNQYLIRVADNGCGIPDEKKKLIFERFYRMDQAHRDKEHFGLGLCIAYEIVRLHRGKIWAEDTPGGGAPFVISLPN